MISVQNTDYHFLQERSISLYLKTPLIMNALMLCAKLYFTFLRIDCSKKKGQSKIFWWKNGHRLDTPPLLIWTWNEWITKFNIFMLLHLRNDYLLNCMNLFKKKARKYRILHSIFVSGLEFGSVWHHPSGPIPGPSLILFISSHALPKTN